MTGTAAAPRDDGDRAALLAALIEGERSGVSARQVPHILKAMREATTRERGAEPQGSPWLCQSVTDGTDAEPILAT